MNRIYRYRLNGLELPLGDRQDIVTRALHDWRIDAEDLIRAEILRESLDARRAGHPVHRYLLELELRRPYRRRMLEPLPAKDPDPEAEFAGTLALPETVHVVGSGPCGIAVAIALQEKGYAVILHERGADLVERSRKARHLIHEGTLDPETNFLFGEGGAGTFTDGKLTTRARGMLVRTALKMWVECGEEPAIQWQSKPHLGTDRMRMLVAAERRRFEEAGGRAVFSSRLEDIEVRDGRLVRACFSGTWENCEALVLAVGHSARDTLTMLVNRGVAAERKDFAVGARIEHPQALINGRQYRGARAGEERFLGAAEYFLSCASLESGEPGAYSFCMCPGGEILPTTTESDELATNGMSFRARRGPFANSGLVVPVRQDDISAWCRCTGTPDDALAGLAFQGAVERVAAHLGGAGMRAPAQRVEDFMEGRVSASLPKTSYARGLESVDLHDLFPDFVARRLAGSLPGFDRKIPGFIHEGLFIAPETRTSSPLRFPRDPETLASTSVDGLFVLGEGAGWSGGIVTSAADGLRLAHRARALR